MDRLEAEAWCTVLDHLPVSDHAAQWTIGPDDTGSVELWPNGMATRLQFDSSAALVDYVAATLQRLDAPQEHKKHARKGRALTHR